MVSYTVYIDESGDEGFQFEKGSTEWFVLSAVITEKSSDLETVKLVDAVRSELGRSDTDKTPFHFRTIKHEQRLPFLHHIANANLRSVVVMIHKPSIINIDRFKKRNGLYFYASRLLLERTSWYCRDHFVLHRVGDGSAEICFSNRGGLRLNELTDYMDILQYEIDPKKVNIDWNVIKSQQIRAFPPHLMGLQLADAVASSFFFGLQPRYGFVEERYAKMLKPIMYHNNQRYSGYGVVVWPLEAETWVKKQDHLKWFREVYDF
jgi:hypothetical protein